MALVDSHRQAAYPHSDSRPWFSVTLPDFFVSFFSVQPKLNPHLESAGKASEAWIAQMCSRENEAHRKRLAKILDKIHISHACAIAAPEADEESLRTICDWTNWLIPFDDMFDNGALKDDPTQAQAVVDRLLCDMESDEPPSQRFSDEVEALLDIHRSIWLRVLERSSRDVSRRFAKAITDYCRANLEQVDNMVFSATPDPELYIATRRKAVAFAPIFALIEYAHDLDIPQEVFDHKSMQELNRIALDFAALHNDALSYSKEQSEGIPHNLVAVYRMAGYTAQQSFDKIDELLRIRYREWFLAQADLPQWGEKIDSQVQAYLRGVQNVVVANLNWSLKTVRYFGSFSEEVRKSRLIDVLPVDPIRYDEAISVRPDSPMEQSYGIHTPILE